MSKLDPRPLKDESIIQNVIPLEEGGRKKFLIRT